MTVAQVYGQKDSVRSIEQPGGGTLQPADIIDQSPVPASVRHHQATGTAAGYKTQAKKDGIPFRSHGLFPPNDELLLKLASHPGQWPFEKHLPGRDSPYELLPHGGWITGDAAAQRGIDLRLFYKEPQRDGTPGSVHAAVRFGEGASIGPGFYLSAHGGAIETVLDEATAELAKMELIPFVSTREASFSLRRPVPLHTTLLVQCTVSERRGIRCWVEGSIASPDGVEVYATCKTQMVDMTHFIGN